MEYIEIDDIKYQKPQSIEVNGEKRFYITIPDKDRQKVKSIVVQCLPLQWEKDMEQRGYYTMDERYLPLFKEWLLKENEEAKEEKKSQGKNKLEKIIYQKRLAENHIIKSFESEEQYAAFLCSMAKFPYMNLTNIAIISALKPYATYLKTLSDWNKQSITIIQGKKGVAVLEPSYMPESDESTSPEESVIKTTDYRLKSAQSTRIGIYTIQYGNTKDDRGKKTYNIYRDAKNKPILIYENISTLQFRSFIKNKVLGIELQDIPESLNNLYDITDVRPLTIKSSNGELPLAEAEKYMEQIQKQLDPMAEKDIYNKLISLMTGNGIRIEYHSESVSLKDGTLHIPTYNHNNIIRKILALIIEEYTGIEGNTDIKKNLLFLLCKKLGLPCEINLPKIDRYADKYSHLNKLKNLYDGLINQIEKIQITEDYYEILLQQPQTATAELQEEQKEQEQNVSTEEFVRGEQILEPQKADIEDNADTDTELNQSEDLSEAMMTDITDDSVITEENNLYISDNEYYEEQEWGKGNDFIEDYAADTYESTNIESEENVFDDYESNTVVEEPDIYDSITQFSSHTEERGDKEEQQEQQVEDAVKQQEIISNTLDIVTDKIIEDTPDIKEEDKIKADERKEEEILLRTMPDNISDILGGYMNIKNEYDDPISIEISDEGITISTAEESYPFSIIKYNSLIENGYRKIINDNSQTIDRLITIMELYKDWEYDYVTTMEEFEQFLQDKVESKLDIAQFKEEIRPYDPSEPFALITTMDKHKYYGIKVTSIEFLKAFLNGELRDYDGYGCSLSAAKCSRNAIRILKDNSININDYDDEDNPVNLLILHHEDAEIVNITNSATLCIKGNKIKSLTDSDLKKIEKINEYFLGQELPLIKGSIINRELYYVVKETPSDEGMEFDLIEPAVNEYKILQSNKKNIYIGIRNVFPYVEPIPILKKGKVFIRKLSMTHQFDEIKELDETIAYLSEEFGVLKEGIINVKSNEPTCPSKERWINYNAILTGENVEITLWQLKEQFRDEYRGRSYDCLINIEKKEINQFRYDEVMELTLKSCESLNKLSDSLYYQLAHRIEKLNDEDTSNFLEIPLFVIPGKKLIRAYLGDIIEIKTQDYHTFNYIDTIGFVQLETFNPVNVPVADIRVAEFLDGYLKNPILAITRLCNTTLQKAKIIHSLRKDILLFPQNAEELEKYKKKGLALANAIMKNIDYAPVLICNKAISIFSEDEKALKESNAEMLKNLNRLNKIIRRNNVVPLKVLNEAVMQYNRAATFMKGKGEEYYKGTDILKITLYGKHTNDNGENLYAYYTEVKIGADCLGLIDHMKKDMNSQYERLLNEYSQQKRNNEPITDTGRKNAKNEMQYYYAISQAINNALIKKTTPLDAYKK